MPLTIYRSSAGSGKTFTLVKEYLKIVLQDPGEYKHVLAITFTNKATEEMKNRIIEELTQISNGLRTDMFELLEKEFKEEKVEINILENTRKTLRNILHNYARFEISTIDSFFSRIIRSFSRELNLPMQYSIDLDQDKALDSSIEQLYENIHNDTELVAWLNKFTQDRIKANHGWGIDFQIRNMGKELFKEKFFELSRKKALTLKELELEIKKMEKEMLEFEEEMEVFQKDILAMVEQAGLEPSDFRKYAFSFFTTRISKQQYFKELGKNEQQFFDGEIEIYTKSSKKKEEIIDLLDSGLNDLLFACYFHFIGKGNLYRTNKMVLENIYSYGVLSTLAKELKKYRDENNLLLISDTNSLIREVIRDEDAPFILEKVGSVYKHILVDEFQDTSDYQWHNLLPLVKNSLAEQHHVLLVGDVKQSIYRWRGGNMHLLLEGVQQDLKPFEENTFVKQLQSNWRSKANIVNFNNAFFKEATRLLNGMESLKESSLIERAYEAFEQSPEKEEGGYVHVQFFANEKKETEEEAEVNLQEEDTLDPHNNALLEIIQQAKEDQFDYSDILILVSRNKEATLLAEVLTKKEIPIITRQSLLLKNSPDVRLLISFLEFLHTPYDPLTRSKLLFQYCSSIQEDIDDLHLLFTDYQKVFVREEESDKNSQTSNSEHLVDNLFNKKMPQQFLENIETIRRRPLVEIVEQLIFVLGLNLSVNNYIQRFQDACLELAVKGAHTISEFLDWWDEKKNELSILSPEGGDAVRIMTIHKAKGLEAPIIILPFSNYPLQSRGKNIVKWVDELEGTPFEKFMVLPLKYKKELAHTLFGSVYHKEKTEMALDALNQTYVAFTRPKERLYVLCADGKLKDDPKSVNEIIEYLFSSEDFSFHTNWNPEKRIFELGKAVPKQLEEQNQVKKEQIFLETYWNSPYTQKINIRSEADRYYEVLDDEKTDRITAGIKVHAVLEKMDHRKELDRVIDQLILDRVLKETDRENIGEQVIDLLNREKFSQWFENGWDVLPERSIVSNGQVYKPDRVIVRDRSQQAIAIDYKKEIRSVSHQAQIRAYGKVLYQMGYENIQLYIVYVEGGRIDEVEFKPPVPPMPSISFS